MKRFIRNLVIVLAWMAAISLCPPLTLRAQSVPDPWKALNFLLGSWEAKAQGAAGAAASGSYTFQLELAQHVLARHSRTADCKGPATYDCDHGDLFYIYQEGAALKAIYFDSEGHVIHYNVSTPDATTAVFLSDGAQPGPQFRLTYELHGAVMLGRFQVHAPGQADWHSYLEWSGAKK